MNNLTTEQLISILEQHFNHGYNDAIKYDMWDVEPLVDGIKTYSQVGIEMSDFLPLDIAVSSGIYPACLENELSNASWDEMDIYDFIDMWIEVNENARTIKAKISAGNGYHLVYENKIEESKEGFTKQVLEACNKF